MAVFAQLGSIELCKIREWSEPDPVIADRHQTANGRWRQDYLAVTRSWRITLGVLTQAEREALVTLITGNPGTLKWWIDEFSGTPTEDSIDAYVSIVANNRMAKWYRSLAGFDFRGGTLTILVQAAEPESDS